MPTTGTDKPPRLMALHNESVFLTQLKSQKRESSQWASFYKVIWVAQASSSL